MHSQWFREGYVDWNRLKLGLNGLPGRTPNLFTTTQTIRVFGGSKTFGSARLWCRQVTLLVQFLECVEKNVFHSRGFT